MSSSLAKPSSLHPQASLLFSQTPKMTGMNIRITACEAASESILQLSLQLFIIFQRAQYDYLQVD